MQTNGNGASEVQRGRQLLLMAIEDGRTNALGWTFNAVTVGIRRDYAAMLDGVR